MLAASPGKRIFALDGVRAAAIALVVFDHAVIALPAAHLTPMLLASAEAAGSLGVNIFFVLSGFLITLLLLDERRRTGAIDLRAFYVRRIRRIFPAYYVFLALIALAVVAGIGVHVAPLAFVFDALYLRNYAFFVPGDWWTGHSWSLCIEEQFYLFWPALLIAFGGRFATRFALGAVLLAPLLRLGAYLAFPHYRDDISIMLPTRIDLLMSGALLALIVARRERARRALEPLRARAAVPLALAVLLAGIPLEARFHGLYALTVGYTLTGVAVATLLLHLVERPQSPLARLASASPAVWLGRISYSLYLWQQPFLNAAINATPLGRLPLNILAAVALAAGSYYLVERRFLRAPRRLRETTAPAQMRGEDSPVASGVLY